MTSSILNDTKHALGLLPDDSAFDSDVIMHINTVLSILGSLGAGPVEGYMITGPSETWDQFYENNLINSIRSYVYLRVKLLFDVPVAGPLISVHERQIEEMTFRILSEVDF